MRDLVLGLLLMIGNVQWGCNVLIAYMILTVLDVHKSIDFALSLWCPEFNA